MREGCAREHPGAFWLRALEPNGRHRSLHACFALGWVRGGRGVAAFPARAPKDAPRAGYAPPGGPRGYNPPRDGMAQVIRPRSWNCGHGVKLSRLMTRNSSRRSRKSATGVGAVCASCAVAARQVVREAILYTYRPHGAGNYVGQRGAAPLKTTLLC